MTTLRVNGQERTYDGDPSMPLLWYLRDELGLTGTKFGCGAALCGNCTVHVDGTAVRSCVTPMSELSGKSVTTIEGVASGEQLDAVQQAFIAHGAAQCGICTPGMVLAAVSLRDRNSNPGDDDIRTALAGNLCRCTGYMKIFEAVRRSIAGSTAP